MAGAAYDLKAENKIAAGWLLNYHERRRQYIEAKEQFTELAATVYDGMPHGSDIGRPTERKGTTLSELSTMEQWLMTVEDTERCLSEKRRVFLQFRRLAVNMEFKQEVGRPGWVDYVQAKYAEWHYERYGKASTPDRKELFRWWNEIVDICVRIAIRRHCL